MTRENDNHAPGSPATREQNLQPLGIYAVNRILGEIVRDLLPADDTQQEQEDCLTQKNISVSPVVFDKANRTFHYAAVTDTRWEVDSEEKQEPKNNDSASLLQNRGAGMVSALI